MPPPASRHEATRGQWSRPASLLIRGDRPKWRTNIRQYYGVTYRQVFPGVDALLNGRGQNLEMDFVVSPGADPSAIELRFDGVSRVEKDREGDLVLHTARRTIRMERPFVYQEIAGLRRPARGSYIVTGENRVSFRLGPYDSTKSLVIDPVISFADFVGVGATDVASAVAVDAQGNVYITGGTTSADFPAAGSLQTFAGLGPVSDVFVTKLDSTGSNILYSTFVGGVGLDAGLGIAVDSTGSAYVTGMTTSPDFPVRNAFQGTLHVSPTSIADGFVFKLSPSGSELVYSTFLGGSKDDISRAIAVDADGNAIVVGAAKSADFPVRNAFQPANRGAGTFEGHEVL